MNISSPRAYLLNALIEWVLDNGDIPYMVIDTNHDAVNVPADHVYDGRITLNVSPTSVHDFVLNSDGLRMKARFNGVSQDIEAPVGQIVSLFGKESQQGMWFDVEDVPSPRRIDDPPHLRVVSTNTQNE